MSPTSLTRVELPDGYVEPPLERVPGGADITGETLPGCRPEHHDDGKHSALCIGGILGYRRTEEGDFERFPSDPMTVVGARFSYEGQAYVRPLDRGIVLEDSPYTYLEDLPDGDYAVRLEFVRQPLRSSR